MSLRPISAVLAQWLEELDVPAEAGGTVDLGAEIRRRIWRSDLWSAGTPGEQLAFDLCGGTAVAR